MFSPCRIRRRNAAAAIPLFVGVAVLLLLLSLAAAPAHAALVERLAADPLSRAAGPLVRRYETMAEVEAEAAARGMSVQQFLASAEVTATYAAFACDEGTTILSGCVEVVANGTRCRGIDWQLPDYSAPVGEESTFTLDGSVGIDICRYSTCVRTECRDPAYPAVMQVMSGQEPVSCTCAPMSAVGQTVVFDLSDLQLYYHDDSPYYPRDDTRLCARYVCPDATMTPAVVAYGVAARGCVCQYPSNLFNPALRSTYPAVETDTSRAPDEGTPVPIPAESDRPGYVVTTPTSVPTTPDPSLDVLLVRENIGMLCPVLPPALTTPIFDANVDKFCCTVFYPNRTTTACGDNAVGVTPEGKLAYCASTIPSMEFCCQVEHMRQRTYVYRGTLCSEDVPVKRDGAAGPPAIIARMTGALVIAAALAATGLFLPL